MTNQVNGHSEHNNLEKDQGGKSGLWIGAIFLALLLGVILIEVLQSRSG